MSLMPRHEQIAYLNLERRVALLEQRVGLSEEACAERAEDLGDLTRVVWGLEEALGGHLQEHRQVPAARPDPDPLWVYALEGFTP